VLQEELERILAKTMPQAQVQRKKGRVIIHPRKLHKGVAIKRILEAHFDPPDFLMCLGHDGFDEPMYEQVYKRIAALNWVVQHCFTCTVRRKPSHAHMFVHSNADVEQLLAALAEEA
jgi:trehalose-6-phosphatase